MTWDNMTKTQKLIWLKKLSGDGTKLTTITDNPPFYLTSSANKNVKSLIQEGRAYSDGAPSWDNPTSIYCNNGNIVAKHAGTSYNDPSVFETSKSRETVTIYNENWTSSSVAYVQPLFSTVMRYTNHVFDTQEVISGVVTHRTAVLVLDGTENISIGSNTVYRYIYVRDIPGAWKDESGRVVHCLCTHKIEPYCTSDGNITLPNFCKVEDMDNVQLRQFIADQYTNGTPITIVYPLEPTLYYNEQVTPQEMQTFEGKSYLDVLITTGRAYGDKTIQYYQMAGNRTRPIVGTGQVGYAVI